MDRVHQAEQAAAFIPSALPPTPAHGQKVPPADSNSKQVWFSITFCIRPIPVEVRQAANGYDSKYSSLKSHRGDQSKDILP